jgi:hypothetical protein
MIARPSKKIREKFLKDFSQELIQVRGDQILGDLKEKGEKQRIKREIEGEKLRKKYIHKQEFSPAPEPRPMMQPSVYKQFVGEQVQQIPIRPARPEPIQPVQRQMQPPQLMQPRQPMQPAPINAQFSGLNLGKINGLIKDPSVQSIECEGPKKQLIIKQNGQVVKSEIKLEKSDIDKIINEFSEKARIPLVEGMLRARVANMQISAVVSKVASSRFIITKIYAPIPITIGTRQPVQLNYNQPIMPPIQRPFMPRPGQQIAHFPRK